MLRFKQPMADGDWPNTADNRLFTELLKARQQEFDYIGLRWNGEQIWDQICKNINIGNGRKYNIDEVKNRVKRYTISYEMMGDQFFVKKYFIDVIGPAVLKKSIDIGPPSVPKPCPKPSTTTSKKRAKPLDFVINERWSSHRDFTLFQQLIKARTQEFDYISFDWKDDQLWTKLHKEVNNNFFIVRDGEIDIEDVKDRVRAYQKAYKKYGERAFEIQIPEMIPKCMELFGEGNDIGPPIVPRTSTSTLNSKCNSKSTAHGGCKRASCNQETDTPSLVKEIDKMCDVLSIDERLWTINHFLKSERAFFDMDENMRVKYIKKFFVE